MSSSALSHTSHNSLNELPHLGGKLNLIQPTLGIMDVPETLDSKFQLVVRGRKTYSAFLHSVQTLGEVPMTLKAIRTFVRNADPSRRAKITRIGLL